MNGIYLTQEGKQAIEAKIAELDKDRQHWLDNTIKNIGNPNYDSLMDSINQTKAEQVSYLLQAEIIPVLAIPNISEASFALFHSFNKLFSLSNCNTFCGFREGFLFLIFKTELIVIVLQPIISDTSLRVLSWL